MKCSYPVKGITQSRRDRLLTSGPCCRHCSLMTRPLLRHVTAKQPWITAYCTTLHEASPRLRFSPGYISAPKQSRHHKETKGIVSSKCYQNVISFSLDVSATLGKGGYEKQISVAFFFENWPQIWIEKTSSFTYVIICFSHSWMLSRVRL